ncbi:hypothetical protein [Sporolactobacillus spathodeae]|uniref:Beta-1,6-galactofuranosyltransferase n=1 Tax=Sporolactobacillus spathodeae TaxID=1465502 RepID=A0ABS2Q7K6_9BACL|nr:hypothetical protein [Sporolactobacillus spathodeae]MBM7657773.1 hypothetical protein [Sporolactobacillus spathodeae]
MNKYYLIAKYNRDYRATSKARMDAERIMEQQHYNPVSREEFIENSDQYQNSLFVVQYPDLFHNREILFTMKLLKRLKCTSIILIHDLNYLRNKSISSKDEQEILKQSDFLIVHNKKMEDYLVQFDIPRTRMIRLELFDYLFCASIDRKIKNIVSSRYDIIIAGDLSMEKSAYIRNLNNLPYLNFNLFGSDPQINLPDNTSYLGKYSGDDLPNYLPEGWGLIWDGNSLKTCNGQYGSYQRFNNPHKASLFLATGIPLIVWEHAAIRDFIVQNKLGISVTTLFDIDKTIHSLTDIEKIEIQKHLDFWSKRIRRGYFLQKSLNSVEEKI